VTIFVLDIEFLPVVRTRQLGIQIAKSLISHVKKRLLQRHLEYFSWVQFRLNNLLDSALNLLLEERAKLVECFLYATCISYFSLFGNSFAKDLCIVFILFL
jgi:hypothetical protein